MLDFFLVLWLWHNPAVIHFVFNTEDPQKRPAPSEDKPQCGHSLALPMEDDHKLRFCISIDGIWIVEEWPSLSG